MVAVIGCKSDAVQKICDAASTAANGVPISIANYLVDGNYAVSGRRAPLHILSACVIDDGYVVSRRD
jgi:malonyl CoA-acyl carrier protein transacylase